VVWHNGIRPLLAPPWGIYWSFCALCM
jgi:hypothetical protein